MSTYTKTTNFTAKDNLTSGDPAKVIKGSEFDTEFNAIETAVNSKADKNNGSHTGTTTISTANIDTLQIDGVAVTATSAELNTLDGITASTAELNITDGLTASTSELNILDGATLSTAELNKLDGFTGTVDDLNYAKDLRATGVTTAEFDKLDGLTATTTELNYTDGVTSNIQTQLDSMVEKAGDTMTGDLSLGDSVKAKFGAGDDLQIYHDSTTGHSYIKESGSGDLILQAGNDLRLEDPSGNEYLRGNEGASVDIAYNGSTKLATTSTGVDVTGTISADALDIAGAITADGLTVDGDVSFRRAANTGQFISFNSDITGTTVAQNSAGGANKGLTIDASVNSPGGGYLKLRTEEIDRLKVDANGNVLFYEDTGTTAKFVWDSSAESLGIGTSPSAPLHVKGGSISTPATASAFISNATSRLVVNHANEYGVYVGYANSSNDAIGVQSARSNGVTSPLLLNPYGGNVGIGTSSPSKPLHIQDTTNDGSGGILLQSYLPVIELDDISGGGTSTVIKHDGTNTIIENGGSERARIDSSGNFYVGTTDVDLGYTDGDTGFVVLPNGTTQCTRDSSYATLYVQKLNNDGDLIEFNKDGSGVGSIGTEYTRLYMDGNSASGIRFGGSEVAPRKNGANADGAVDLGWSGARFKDLYLSGGVYLGGTGSANKLDDYETGTFTPTVRGATTTGTASYTVQFGQYTKIGDTVHFHLIVNYNTLTGTGQLRIVGLPFNTKSTYARIATVGMANISYSGDYVYAFTIAGTNQFGLAAVNNNSGTSTLGVDTAGIIEITGTYHT